MAVDGHDERTWDIGHYEAIAESFSEAAYLLDSDQHIVYTNRSARRHPDGTPEAVQGSHVMDLFEQVVADDEDTARVEQALATVYDERSDAEFPATADVELDAPTGTTTGEYRCSPCETASGTGALVVLAGGVERGERNRGHRQEREERPEENDSVLTQLIGATDDVFWLFDSDFTEVQFVNEAYENVWGRPIADLRDAPMDFIEGIHPDDRDSATDAVERAKNGEATDREYRVNPDEDFGRWVQITTEPIYDDGTLVRVAGFVRDVTEQKERERRLEKLQERLDLAVESAGIGTWDWDVETGEVIFNEEWATMLGYTRSELNFDFEVWEELVHPVDLETATAALEAHMAGETSFYESEIRMQTKSGSWKWVWSIGQVVERAENGDPVRAAGIHISIDERKEAETELRRSQRQFDAVFNDPQILVGVLDTEGVVQQVNETALDSVPATREQVEGTPFSETPWWTHDETVQTDIQERVARAVDGEYVEFEADHPVGGSDWTSVSGSLRPVTDDDGEAVSVVVSARDITERRERERELERKQEFLEQTQDVANVGGWEVDMRSETLRWTEEVYRIHDLGLDFEPVVEEAIDLYHPDDREMIQEAVERATAVGEPYDLKTRIVRPDGEIRWVRAQGKPWYEDGEIIGARGTFQDITAQKEREDALEQSNERLEQFAYVASHDLQEPLRTISNYADMLAEDYADQLDEDAQRFTDVVVTGCERMQSMINGLLDYSRVTTRGSEFESIDAGQVAADTVDGLEFMLDEHDGTVEIGDLPTVDADGDQLYQVFQNLVKNALEHSGDDQCNISVRASEESTEYRFEVEDDGPGIEASRQEKIFRIFKSGKQYQTESQAKGLGLAICDNIVRRHGGDIWVDSDPGDGATFVFTIDKERKSVGA